MSLFGSLMGDFDDDIFGNHMNAMNMQMRSMNRLMNSFMPDPFNMLTNFDGGFQQNALMERQNPHPMGGLFGFPAMPNMNRLLTADIGNNGGAAFCSSSVITMSSGPDGRPQIYQATSSTKTGPGGIRETRRTVQDSVNGVKKMAIGHHIGDRAHIIEKEQDLRSGQLEEHQEFINLDEDEAEDFDREFTTKARGPAGRMGARAICAAAPVAPPQQTLTIEEIEDDDDDVIETVPHVQRPSSSSSQHRRHMPAIPAPSQPPSTQLHQNSSTSKLSTSTTSSATKMSPSSPSSTSRNNINARSSTTTMSTSSTPTITTSSSSSVNNNPYLSTTPRRSTYRGSHHLTGASARRPLRTPPSSPLATTPTIHSHSTASTPSVHPHPYNSSAARRSHHHHHSHHHQHRPKQHATKQQYTTTTTSANSNNQTSVSPSQQQQQQPREEDSNSK
ncbi:myeloid leukemia factor isoform X2 [Lucilia sericata]|uniref:myeloid leukemia factor isoform X2 n=1 Tax=Lucilia sericata TaxID=13632 RepID=UPI0018A840B1|nr:myeloid leukemia factor isoform X2 [Lucilia sericata]